MLINLLKKIYVIVNNFINYFFTTKRLNMPNGGLILILIILVGGFIIKFLNTPTFTQIWAAVFGSYLFFVFLLYLIKYGIFKYPKFIFGDYNTSEKLLKSFTHRAFIYGASVLSAYATFLLMGIGAYASLIFREKVYIFTNSFDYVYYFTLSIFSILWFSYHIIFETIPLKLIKTRLSLYVAIHTSISIILVLTIYENALKPFLTSTAIAFIWLTFLIDYKDYFDSINTHRFRKCRVVNIIHTNGYIKIKKSRDANS